MHPLNHTSTHAHTYTLPQKTDYVHSSSKLLYVVQWHPHWATCYPDCYLDILTHCSCCQVPTPFCSSPHPHSQDALMTTSNLRLSQGPLCSYSPTLLCSITFGDTSISMELSQLPCSASQIALSSRCTSKWAAGCCRCSSKVECFLSMCEAMHSILSSLKTKEKPVAWCSPGIEKGCQRQGRLCSNPLGTLSLSF